MKTVMGKETKNLQTLIRHFSKQCEDTFYCYNHHPVFSVLKSAYTTVTASDIQPEFSCIREHRFVNRDLQKCDPGPHFYGLGPKNF
ncbi:hypothetical protein CEXT_452351 [Caerostris extrusa]|uniref:Uncharacterized protein n=1 Tax=Caerostris extrusa TaxID=172846 RepID=A0AAV4VB39_CAEEX|nr:hypothetical protein CEXT_452351 [Caerostris extrusa]